MKEEYEQSKLIKHGGKESMTHLTGKHHAVKTKAIEKKKKTVGMGYVNAERAYTNYMTKWKHENPDEFSVQRAKRRHDKKERA